MQTKRQPEETNREQGDAIRDAGVFNDALDILQDEQSIVDETEKEETPATVQYDITSYGADYDVEGLVNRLNREDIRIPEFQRSYIWNLAEASKFVESLLLGLPVPGVFFAKEESSNKHLVIDGQQRLKTLQYFYSGVFKPKSTKDKAFVFKLTGVQPKFEGRTRETLDEPDKVKLNDSLIHATIVRQESPKDDDTSIYEIFFRLNSQGRRLTPQEIRVAIDHGAFVEMLKELNEYGPWREIYGKKSNRLKDQELILRFLAFYFEQNTYTKPMNSFLNLFSKRKRSAAPDFLEAAKATFTGTIDLVLRSMGNRAFRPVNALNAAVFDSVMVGLARRLASGNPIQNLSSVNDAYTSLLADKSNHN